MYDAADIAALLPDGKGCIGRNGGRNCPFAAAGPPRGPRAGGDPMSQLSNLSFTTLS